MNIIYFDTETLARTEDEDFQNDDILIQLAYLKQSEEEISYNEDMMKPKRYKDMTPRAMSFHNITPETLNLHLGKEHQKTYQEMKEFSKDKENIFIAHNLPFDQEVLRRADIDISDCRLIDTLKVAKFINDKQYLKWEMLSLQYLKYFYRLDKYIDGFKKKYNIESKYTAHDALSDVIDLYLGTQRFRLGFQATFEQMIEITKNPIFLTYMPFGSNRGTKIKDLTYGQLEWNAENSFDEDVRYTCKKILEGCSN